MRAPSAVLLAWSLTCVVADCKAQPLQEQIEFVAAGTDLLTQAHAEEEGGLSSAVIAASRAVVSLEREAESLHSRLADAQSLVAERRRALPPHPLYAHGAVSMIETRQERIYRERLVALEEAEATLRHLQQQRSKSLADLAAARQLETSTQTRLADARTTNAADRLELTRAITTWQAESNRAAWISLTGTITRLTSANGAAATIKFQSQPINRVTLRYQTLDERADGLTPHTTDNPTDTFQPIPYGWYYIWYERDGLIKSDYWREYPIVRSPMEITVDIHP
jgi:hypothetical protein